VPYLLTPLRLTERKRRKEESGAGRWAWPSIVRRVERNDWVVVFVSGGERYKLVRILFGSDGSYFVSCPYRDADRAHLAIVTVNYAKQEMQVALDQTVASAAASDVRRAIKLAHHPDGFIQFSGPGITSGRNKDGSPKHEWHRGAHPRAPLLLTLC
jgi:hypothetical protein